MQCVEKLYAGGKFQSREVLVAEFYLTRMADAQVQEDDKGSGDDEMFRAA